MSCGLFRTFACGSFRSWTFSPLPQSIPRKNPNYLRNTAAPGGKQASSPGRQTSEAQLSRPRNGCYAPPPFLDRAFQLRCRSLKAKTQAARVSESRPIKRVLCTPRMRRSRVFFHPLNRRAEAAPRKAILNKVCHSVNLCPISPISPISLRNAPAAPFECPSQ